MPANYVSAHLHFPLPHKCCHIFPAGPLPSPPLHPSITPSGRATVTRRRRRHLGRGKHVASGEEGGGRGRRRARKVPAQVEESRPANWQPQPGTRAGRAAGRQVVFFTGEGISETRPYLGGECDSYLTDWRRRRRTREGLLYIQSSKQPARRQAECRPQQSRLCVSPSLGGGVAPGQA